MRGIPTIRAKGDVTRSTWRWRPKGRWPELVMGQIREGEDMLWVRGSKPRCTVERMTVVVAAVLAGNGEDNGVSHFL